MFYKTRNLGEILAIIQNSNKMDGRERHYIVKTQNRTLYLEKQLIKSPSYVIFDGFDTSSLFIWFQKIFDVKCNQLLNEYNHLILCNSVK